MKNNGFKVIAIAALVLGVVGLSIGFAAFSKTLNISSATVSTTARTNVFATAIHYDTTRGATANSTLDPMTGQSSYGINTTNVNVGTLTTDTWSGISFTIDSNEATASLTLNARILNDSTEYTGYLESISSSNGVIECTASSGTSASLVATACTKMSLNVSITEDSGDAYGADSTITSTNAANKTVTSSDDAVRITNSMYNNVQLVFTYNNDATIPDGQFTVTLPAITFGYTSTPTGTIPSGD